MKYTIYGNCQAIALAKVMSVNEKFIQRYSFVRLKPVHRMNLNEMNSFKKNLISTLDLILAQPVSEEFRGGGFGSKEILKKIKHAKKIVYPSMQFYGYFPGMSNFKFKKNVLAQEYIKQKIGINLNDLFHYDFILKSYLNNTLVDDVEKLFFSIDLYSKEFVNNEFLKTMNHLKIKEQEYSVDIRISSYIESNFRDRKLFYTPRHPTSELFVYVASEVFAYVGNDTLDEDTKRRMHCKDPLSHISYPIPDSVIRHLGCKFDDKWMKTPLTSLNILEMIKIYYQLYSYFEIDYLNNLID